jgi:hypothetical protein
VDPTKSCSFLAAPKQIKHHLVLTAPPVTPTTDSSSGPPPRLMTQNPPRHSYPPELFKHSFEPYGSSHAPATGSDAAPDVEMTPTSPLTEQRKRKSTTDAQPIDIDPSVSPSTKKAKKDKKRKHVSQEEEDERAVGDVLQNEDSAANSSPPARKAKKLKA